MTSTTIDTPTCPTCQRQRALMEDLDTGRKGWRCETHHCPQHGVFVPLAKPRPSTKGMKINRPTTDAVARLRLMSDVKEKWERAAKATGTDLSGWLRRAADAALAGGIESHQAAEAERRAVRLELARIGNNVNQIARALNAKEAVALDLDAIRAELARLNAEVGVR